MKSSAAAIAAQLAELAALDAKKRAVGLLDSEHRRRERLVALKAARRRYQDRKIATAKARADKAAEQAGAAALAVEQQSDLLEAALKRAIDKAHRARVAFARYQEVRAAA
ncbi:hypothetical protein [Sphingomonas colocasiae]|uniref:Uncharacterized protein n=1 Tax=Sphingomonas colocasiae TaxID=1848973 RepID=A0ABS7PZM0_9SPHN|nr:hypothetical protein [Sphingomonas colocasiae]MBY8826095.1 hypothetical protein [Sphingomonas colocasiae]